MVSRSRECRERMLSKRNGVLYIQPPWSPTLLFKRFDAALYVPLSHTLSARGEQNSMTRSREPSRSFLVIHSTLGTTDADCAMDSRKVEVERNVRPCCDELIWPER